MASNPPPCYCEPGPRRCDTLGEHCDRVPAAPSAQPDEVVARDAVGGVYAVGSKQIYTDPGQTFDHETDGPSGASWPQPDRYDRSKPRCWDDEPGCDCGGYTPAQPVRDTEEGRR